MYIQYTGMLSQKIKKIEESFNLVYVVYFMYLYLFVVTVLEVYEYLTK